MFLAVERNRVAIADGYVCRTGHVAVQYTVHRSALVRNHAGGVSRAPHQMVLCAVRRQRDYRFAADMRTTVAVALISR
jgi:ribosomal protein L15E